MISMPRCWHCSDLITKLTHRYNGRDFRLTDVSGNVGERNPRMNEEVGNDEG